MKIAIVCCLVLLCGCSYYSYNDGKNRIRESSLDFLSKKSLASTRSPKASSAILGSDVSAKAEKVIGATLAPVSLAIDDALSSEVLNSDAAKLGIKMLAPMP